MSNSRKSPTLFVLPIVLFSIFLYTTTIDASSSTTQTVEVNKGEANNLCVVKGINRSEFIRNYMHPGCNVYSETEVKKENGDQWFCSIGDAQNSGYLKDPGCQF